MIYRGTCTACGTYVATQMEAPRGFVGVINVVGLGVDERIRRRRSRWTPMTLEEPAGKTKEGRSP